MEFKMMKQIYTIMIMNKIIYCTLYKQMENLCQFCSSTVLQRPTSFCYRNQFATILAMCAVCHHCIFPKEDDCLALDSQVEYESHKHTKMIILDSGIAWLLCKD